MDLAPGTEVAGHRVIDTLHAGGMAALYHVAAPDGSVRVLKLPKVDFGSHPSCYAGFEVERIVLERLLGPHAPRLFAGGEADIGPYLICEDLGRDTLAARMEQAPLPTAEVVRLGMALASAISALHHQDVVHHDVKPSHVFFRPGGEAVLIDFGLACHGQLPDFVQDEAQGHDAILGTPAYIAPEQLLGRRGDPRSDIFALGVVLYALTTGELPYGDPAGAAAMRRRLYFDCKPPSAINPDCPDWLQEIILHCLEIEPAMRYGNAAHVATDLAHPDQVLVGERGRRRQHGGWYVALRRWWQSGLGQAPSAPSPARQVSQAPHVLVAIDTEHGSAELARGLREAVRRLIGEAPQWRITCVTVMEPNMLATMEAVPELIRSLHTTRLIELHHWAQPLELPPQRLRFHVLEGSDAAAAVVGYARERHVDHIVVGARGSSQLRRLIGSVSARIAAEAPCSVTIVRTATAGAEQEGVAAP